MVEGKLLFKTPLVDRVYKPWYDKTSNWVLFVLWAISFAVAHSFDNIWIELIPWAALWIWLIYYFYKHRYKRAGTLELYSDRIKIQSEELKDEFFLSEISGLAIQRGSNFHSADVGEKPRMENNFIQFNHNGQAYEFLFLIDSHAQNKVFESTIEALSREEYSLDYRSI